MNNRFFSFIFSLFLAVAAAAQTGRVGQHTDVKNWTPSATSFANAAQGRQIAERIIDAVGLKPSFEIVPAAIDNAAAVVYSGKRYILYNPTFISNLVRTTGTDWAAISVMAHEIGHHLNGHTVSGTGSQPTAELEADEFSGYVLRKMGASLTQAQAAMKTLATVNATRTHPAQDARLASIEKGWNHADDQIAGRPSRTVPDAQPKASPAPVTETIAATTATNAVLDSRYILGDVYFNAAPSSTFYVTTRYNLVKVNNDGISVLGKLAKLSSGDYPYLLYDEQNTQLFVSRTGNILTREGKQVGYLKNHKS